VNENGNDDRMKMGREFKLDVNQNVKIKVHIMTPAMALGVRYCDFLENVGKRWKT
jgi:hypothetical protein